MDIFLYIFSYEIIKDTPVWIHFWYFGATFVRSFTFTNFFFALMFLFLNTSPKLIVTRKQTATSSTLATTLKLLAINKNCEKEKNFDQLCAPVTKSLLLFLNLGYLVTSVAPNDPAWFVHLLTVLCWQIAETKISPSTQQTFQL